MFYYPCYTMTRPLFSTDISDLLSTNANMNGFNDENRAVVTNLLIWYCWYQSDMAHHKIITGKGPAYRLLRSEHLDVYKRGWRKALQSFSERKQQIGSNGVFGCSRGMPFCSCPGKYLTNIGIISLFFIVWSFFVVNFYKHFTNFVCILLHIAKLN